MNFVDTLQILKSAVLRAAKFDGSLSVVVGQADAEWQSFALDTNSLDKQMNRVAADRKIDKVGDLIWLVFSRDDTTPSTWTRFHFIGIIKRWLYPNQLIVILFYSYFQEIRWDRTEYSSVIFSSSKNIP